MYHSKDNNRSKMSTQQLAGLIARMPGAEPPPDLTDAVMRRIQPKKVAPRQHWIRRLQTYWAMLPMQALGVGTAVALIVGGAILFYGSHGGRQVVPTGNAVSTAAKTQVVFMLDWPSARKVAVIGSFNQWNPEGYLMDRASSGEPWIIHLQLEKGKYNYAFLIDDQTVVPDPHSLWQQADGFGNLNSSIIVENGKQNANSI